MVNRSACELNTKIAAFASVAGTIGTSQTCNPGRAVPVCHFHGTADATIGYDNNPYGMTAPETIDFWVTNNACDVVPDSTDLPDIASDGITVRHYLYDNGAGNTTVEHYRAFNADHVWLFLPNNDIFYTFEMWRFFNEHQLPADVGIADEPVFTFNAYPNPSSGVIQLEDLPVDATINVYDMTGKEILSQSAVMDRTTIELPSGIYSIVVRNKDGVGATQKVVVE